MHDTMVSLDFNYCLCVLVNSVLSFMKSLPIGVPAKESCSLKWFADWAAILLSSQKSRRSIHPPSLISTPLPHHHACWRWKTRTGMSSHVIRIVAETKNWRPFLLVLRVSAPADVLLLLLFSILGDKSRIDRPIFLYNCRCPFCLVIYHL